MTPLAVVVPVKDQLSVTKSFVKMLDQQTKRYDSLVILDDDSKAPTINWLDRLARSDDRVSVEWTGGLTIYEAWNRGYWLTRTRFTRPNHKGSERPWHVLIANNDILLPPHALEQMSVALDAEPSRCAAYPDWAAPKTLRQLVVNPKPRCENTRGVWGTGGMLGFCFMLAGHRVNWRPLIQDLAYQWWFGDNALAERIELAGLTQAKVLGLGIQHVHEATAAAFDLALTKERDAKLWASRRNEQRPLGINRGARPAGRRDWRATR
jgi:hypothetical protein